VITQHSSVLHAVVPDAAVPVPPGGLLARYVSVAARGRTYSRVLYLVLTLPIGMFMTLFMGTALTLGVVLAPVGIGLFILGGLASGAWILITIERELAVLLVGRDIRLPNPPRGDREGFLASMTAHLRHRRSWGAVAFLTARFATGAASAALVVGGLGVASVLTAAPILMPISDMDLGFWRVNEVWEAFVLAIPGPPLAIAGLHLANAGAIANVRLLNMVIGEDGGSAAK
jgi:hypothetical protein